MKRALLTLLVAVVGLVNATGATAAKREVDDDGLNCPHAHYTSIQAAVDAASPGDLIAVCAGTYSERVRVNKAVTLRSYPAMAATITTARLPMPPSTLYGVEDGVIELTATSVRLLGFRIVGPPPPATECGQDPLQALVWVKSGKAVVDGNHIGPIQESGCNGAWEAAVRIGDCGQTQALRATIDRNVIQAGGQGDKVWGVQALGGYSVVQRNTITATSDGLVRTGVSFAGKLDTCYSARGEIRVNNVSGWAEGISFGAGADLSRYIVRGNKLHENHDSLIQDNRIRRSSEIGLRLGFSADTARNRVTRNTSLDSGNLDCEDTSLGSDPQTGTANKWTGNVGRTDDPAALCASP